MMCCHQPHPNSTKKKKKEEGFFRMQVREVLLQEQDKKRNAFNTYRQDYIIQHEYRKVMVSSLKKNQE